MGKITPNHPLFKGKFIVLAVWLVVTVALVVLATPLSTVIEKKGKVTLPESAVTTIANKIQSDHSMNTSDIKTFAIVFSSSEKLTEANRNDISQIVKSIDAQKDALHIVSINSPTEEAQLKEQLEAKNGKSIVVTGSADMDKQTVAQLKANLQEKVSKTSLNTYITGKMFIDDASEKQTKSGVKRGLVIAIILFMISTIAVTRKIVPAMLILFVSVINFIVTSSIYSMLANYDSVKATTLTPIVLGAIVFSFTAIHVFSYFKEYEKHVYVNGNLHEAIIATYQGKFKSTVVSHLVLAVVGVGFLFTTFQMYTSFFIVSIAAIVMALSTLTFLPIILFMLGKAAFFPGTAQRTFNQSSLFSLQKTGMITLIGVIILIPSLSFLQPKESYSTLDGLPQSDESVKGYHFIQKEYSLGAPLPITMYVESGDKWNTTKNLTIAEGLSRQLQGLENVASVRSATRPYGNELEPLLLVNQLSTLEKGIGKGNDGVNQIKTGLSSAKDELQASAPKLTEATDGISKLVNGTDRLQTGLGQLADGLQQLETGLQKGSIGANQLTTGLQSAKENTRKLLEGSKALLVGYKKVEDGLKGLTVGMNTLQTSFAQVQGGFNLLQTKFGDVQNGFSQVQGGFTKVEGGFGDVQNGFATLQAGFTKLNKEGVAPLTDGSKSLVANFDQILGGYSKLQTSFTGIHDGAAGLNQAFAQIKGGIDGSLALAQKLVADNPSLGANPTMQQLLGTLQAIASGSTTYSAKFTGLTQGTEAFKNGLATLSGGMTAYQGGLATFNGGMTNLSGGATALSGGFDQFGKGLSAFNGGLTQLDGGLTSFNNGLGAYKDGLSKFNGGLGQFAGGIDKAAAGVTALSDGIQLANANFVKVVDGQEKLVTGLTQLYNGMSQLEDGVGKAAAGQSTVISKLPAFADGLSQLKNGQLTLGDGIGLFVNKVGELQTGLGDASNGLAQVYTGLTSAKGYLSQVSSNVNPTITGWYIPEEALKKEEFTRIFDTYMSKDFNVMKVDMNLGGDPLSAEGYKAMNNLVTTAKNYLEAQGVNRVRVGVSGDPATIYDLKTLQTTSEGKVHMSDLTWMYVYSAMAIFLILAVAYRSIFKSLFFLFNGALMYFVSFTVVQFYFSNVEKYAGIKFIAPILGVLVVGVVALTLLIHGVTRENGNVHFQSSTIGMSLILGISFIGFLFAGNILFIQTALGVIVGVLGIGLLATAYCRQQLFSEKQIDITS